jgi:acyl-coenzyme A thioesterase PaaI-like protein
MQTTHALLRAAIGGAGDDLTLTLDPAFQGLPDTAHGGTLLAVFDTIAGSSGPRDVVGHYRRRVPLGVPLKVAVARSGSGVACRVLDASASTLVEGEVQQAATVDGDGGGATSGVPLPVSRTCFACGTDNPIGLRVALAFDARTVGGTWKPDARFATGDGRLPTVALTTLLDEAAFWLGALATGESGMTTELRVTLVESAAAGAAVRVGGERAAARPRADDGRYWDTRVAAWDERGRLLASAAITFVAVRGAARRLVNGLLSVNQTDVVRRVFPAYTP